MDYTKLWQDIASSFKSEEFLQEALVHSSVTRDDETVVNNERLEYMGDAVLKLVVTNYLFETYPKKQEGTLTKYRAKLISDKLLAKLAKKINLAAYIKFGSTVNPSAVPDSILGDALEAVIGAIYLDAGYQKAQEFITALWSEEIEQAIKDSIELEFKSRLQEMIQAKYKKLPEYKTLAESGPAHNKEFEIGVYLDDKLLASAASSSKKEASQLAAKAALEAKENWF